MAKDSGFTADELPRPAGPTRQRRDARKAPRAGRLRPESRDFYDMLRACYDNQCALHKVAAKGPATVAGVCVS